MKKNNLQFTEQQIKSAKNALQESIEKGSTSLLKDSRNACKESYLLKWSKDSKFREAIRQKDSQQIVNYLWSVESRFKGQISYSGSTEPEPRGAIAAVAVGVAGFFLAALAFVQTVAYDSEKYIVRSTEVIGSIRLSAISRVLNTEQKCMLEIVSYSTSEDFQNKIQKEYYNKLEGYLMAEREAREEDAFLSLNSPSVK